MGIKKKVLKLIIVLAAVSFAGHAIAVEYDPPESTEPPESLEEMINITRRLVNDLKRLDPNTQSEMYQKKRLLIAYWVAIASDKRIYNCNDTEVAGNISGCWSLQEARKKWTLTKTSEKLAKFAWENQAGKCEENSNLVYYILKQSGVTDTLRILWSDCWHGFVVWGVQEGADLNSPLTWNSDALVLDSWAGQVLTPSEAHHDKYIGNGGINPIEDKTVAYDNTKSAWSSGMAPADTPSLNNNEIPDSFRYTCNIKDENNDKSNLCEMWVKESESHKDIIVRNKEEKKKKKLLLCHKKSQEDGECDIVMQNARDVCTSWMNKGWLYFIQTPPYGGGKICLTPKGVARVGGGGGGGWKHTATPLGKPCDNASD